MNRHMSSDCLKDSFSGGQKAPYLPLTETEIFLLIVVPMLLVAIQLWKKTPSAFIGLFHIPVLLLLLITILF